MSSEPQRPLPIVKAVEAPLQAPEPAPEPTRQPLNSCELIKSLIAQYDWNVSVAMAVMEAESNCNPAAIGDTRPINGLLAHSCGLYQVRVLKGRPTCEQLKDPATNVEWAYKIYSAKRKDGTQSMWKPWSVFTNGKYKRYLRS